MNNFVSVAPDTLSTQVTVGVVAFNDVRSFQLSVPCEVFGESDNGQQTIVRVCSIETGPVRTSNGFVINTPFGYDDIVKADLVFVPSWRNPLERPPQPLLNALTEAHRNGATVVGLCLGAYALAEAGLLDDRRATTHWAFAADFRQRFPNTKFEDNVLYVDEGRVLTSAGVAAGLDCCLHIARRLFGSKVANGIARNLVFAPFRHASQAQFISQSSGGEGHAERLQGMIDEFRSRVGMPASINSFASGIGMSRRSFTRFFKEQTGMTFGAWLLNERLMFCQNELEDTQDGMATISARAGFGSPLSMRDHFRKAFGMSPSQWRKSFCRR